METVFASMLWVQLVVQRDNFHMQNIRQVALMHRHILHHLVALGLEVDHDSLVVDTAAGHIAEVAVGFDRDIPVEEVQQDILDYMPAVPSAVHVRVALVVGIVHIVLEVDNLELEHIDPEVVVLHMAVDHLGKDMTFFLYDKSRLW